MACVDQSPLYRLSHNQAGWSRQWLVLQRSPSRLLEPGTHFLLAIHIPFACEHLELTGHQGGKRWLGVRWIGPEVDQQQASTNGDALTSTLEQCKVMLRREQMHDIRDKNCIMTFGNRILEESSFDNFDLFPSRSTGQMLTCHSSDIRLLEQRGLQVRAIAQGGEQEGPGAAAEIEHPLVLAKVIGRSQCHRRSGGDSRDPF